MTPPNLPGIGDSKPNKLKPTTNSKIKSIEINKKINVQQLKIIFLISKDLFCKKNLSQKQIIRT